MDEEIREEIIKLINEKGLKAVQSRDGAGLVLHGWGFELVLKNDALGSRWYINDTSGG